MGLLNKQQVTQAGLTPAFVAAGAGGDEFYPGDDTYLEVINGGGAPINVTVVTPKTHRGKAIADDVVAVPAGGRKKLGPYPAEDYANSADGKADVTYSATAAVTVGCFELAAG